MYHRRSEENVGSLPSRTSETSSCAMTVTIHAACLLSAGLDPPGFMSVSIKGGGGGLPLTVKYCTGQGIHDIILVVSGPTKHIARSRKLVPSLCRTQLSKLREFLRNCF